MFKLLSDRIKKISPLDVSSDRYDYIQLSEVEPDLGVPASNNALVSSTTTGVRKWLYPSTGLSVDINGVITVDENTIVIDTTDFNFSNSTNLADVLFDLDQNISSATSGTLTSVVTDTSLDGDGTTVSPLSVLKLATPRTIALTGDVTGSVSFDGSSNVNIVATVLPTGTEVGTVLSITKSITLTTDWQDTGIKSVDLDTGTYMIQLYANDIAAGGSNSNEYYSGIMSWYSGTTDSSVELPTDEIVLHRAGASSDAGLYLRTFRSPISDANKLRLQIYSNQSNASSSNYVFKFRRII